MIRLIKVEFKKLFHKKSFLIVTILFFLYAILTNSIYKNSDSMISVNDMTSIHELEEENKILDLGNEEDLSIYLSNITQIEIIQLKDKYQTNTQKYLIDEYLYSLIFEINEEKYLKKEETLLLIEKKTEYLNHIKEGDWKYFASMQIDELKDTLNNTKDEDVKMRIQELIRLSTYRIEENVSYDEANYLHQAIEEIEQNLVEYDNLSKKERLTHEEESRFSDLKEMMLKNNHILETKQDIYNHSTLQAVFRNFHNEFEIFILIYIVMICGSIMSEEFNKGTIKYLLTKPYRRSTILTAKLITVLLAVPLIILFMVLAEFIVGGFLFGFSSLSIPVAIYQASSGTLLTYSIFHYLFISLLASFPIYLVLIIFCFSLSVITCSTSAAVTITFLFYLAGEVIANLASIYHFKILKAFVSVHWDFHYLVERVQNPYSVNLNTSIFVVILYICVMLCITYVYFNKKDVKNI